MTLVALRLELRRARVLIVAIGALTAIYAGFITLFYSNVAANAAEFEKLLALYPKELMAAFGIEGNFADQGVFLGAYVFSFLWPLVAAMAAIVLATRLAADESRGFLDVSLTTPIPRARYLLASITTQLFCLIVLAALLVAAIFVGDLFIVPNFDMGRVALAGVHSVAFGAAIAGVATLLAVIFLDRGQAAGLSAGILVVMYLLNVLGQLAPDVDGLARLSAFHYFQLRGLIGTGSYPIGDTLLFTFVAVAGWALALVLFRRRDLVAR